MVEILVNLVDALVTLVQGFLRLLTGRKKKEEKGKKLGAGQDPKGRSE